MNFSYLINFLTLAIFFVPCPSNGQRAAKPGDFPWRLRLIIANESDSFDGQLKIDVYFDSKSNQYQNLILSQNSYEPGGVYSSLQKLTESGMANTVPRIEVRAISNSPNCTTGTYYGRLLIEEISLTSFHKRKTFRQRILIALADDDWDASLGVVPQCQNQTIKNSRTEKTIFDKFESIPSNDCYYQGEFYDSDQTFDIGCEMKCRCHDAMVDCDSMCKPLTSPLPRNCRMASIDRKCCDETECMEDALWDSCPIHTAARDKMPPWSVVLTVPPGKNQSSADSGKNCGASIIHRNLLLTSAYCALSGQHNANKIDTSTSILVTPSISNSSVIGRAKAIHIHPSYNGKDPSADLALIELSQDGLQFGDTLRRVNLPWPTLCKRYVVTGCAVQYTTVDNFDSYIGSVVSTSKFCPNTIANSDQQQQKSQIENGTEPIFCIQRMTDGLVPGISKKCNFENGNGVVTKRAQYHYIVGIAAHDYKAIKSIDQQPKSQAQIDQSPESRLRSPILARNKRDDPQKTIKNEENDKNAGSCDRQYIAATNLCPHIDWLKNTINDILSKE